MKKRPHSQLTYAKVDSCIAPLVAMLNLIGIRTLGACCGHGKHKPSIIIEIKGKKQEYFSKKTILRKKRFYKKDIEGYYYIPETKTQ